MGLDCLKNVVTFEAVPAGGSATLPHYLSNAGVALKPDLCIPDLSVFTIDPLDVTDTEITVVNTGNQDLDCRVLCEAWHPIERVFASSPDQDGSYGDHLTPQPFIGNQRDGSANPPIFAGVTKDAEPGVALPLLSVNMLDTHDGTWACKLFYAVEVTDGVDAQVRAGECNALVAFKPAATYNSAHAEADNDAKTAGSINVAVNWDTSGGPENVILTITPTSTLVGITSLVVHYFVLYATHDAFEYV